MKLLEIMLTGFGRWRDAHFTFHPHLNIIFGPNETGKSTLQQALVALLYGFQDHTRSPQQEQELRARYRPWTTPQLPNNILPTSPLRSTASSLSETSPVEILPSPNDPQTEILTAPVYEKISLLAPATSAPEPILASAEFSQNGERAPAESHYGGSLKYALDNEQSFFIHRDFSHEETATQLVDANTGEDALGRYRRGRPGKVDFLEKQIGMSCQVFLAMACLPQGALRPWVEREAHAVAEAILRLLDAGGADHSAEQAIERLEKKLRELGSDQAQMALLPQARQRLEELRETYALRLATQREAQTDLDKIETFELEKDERHAQLALVERKSLQNELTRFETRFGRWQENERQREKISAELAALATYKKFPVDDKEVFFQLMHDFNHQDKLRVLLAEERASLEIKLLALAEKSKNLHVPEQIWQERLFEDFLSLSSRWNETFQKIVDTESARHEVDDAMKKTGLSDIDRSTLAGLDWRQLEEYKALETRFKEAESQVEGAREAYNRHEHETKRRMSYVGIGAATAIVALFVDLVNRIFTSSDNSLGFILPLCFIALIVFVALWVNWGAQSRELGARLLEIENRFMEDRYELRELYSRYGVASIQELEQHRLHFDQFSDVIQSDQRLKDEMNKIEHKLVGWVTALGIGHLAPETVQDAEKRLRESHQIWSARRNGQERLAQIDEKLAQIDKSLGRVSFELEEVLQKAGINEPVSESAFQLYSAGCQKHEYIDTLQMQLQQSQALSVEILDGETTPNLKKTITRLTEELREFDARMKNLVAAPETTKASAPAPSESSRLELQAQREKLQQEIYAKEQNLAVLQERVKTRLQGLPPLAEIEEDIAIVEAEVTGLEKARQALELARDFIAQAAQRLHRDFAPRLNDFLSRHLSQLTNGRYVNALVDPADFSVRLLGPDLVSPVILTQLSLGTVEQVYLLLRAAVLEIFAENGESIPLLLDDPLIHADAQRMNNALQIVAQLAASQQVFYFTKDPLVVEYFKNRPEQGAVIKLEGL